MITMDLVGIKGSRNGLLVSIRDDCEFADGLGGLELKIKENPGFFKGSPVSLDLGWRELREEEFQGLMGLFKEYGLNLLGVISSSLTTRRLLEARNIKVIIGRLGLAQHQGRHKKPGESISPPSEQPPAPAAKSEPPPAPVVEEGPPGGRRGDNEVPVVVVAPPPPAGPALPLIGESAIVVRKTLRSGQRVDFEGNVIILGDVNAGAHVEATGDVVVMGSLRGSIHAGARGRVTACIYALNMHAAMVRVAGQSGEPPKGVRGSGVCTQVRLESGKLVFNAFKPN